MINFKSTSSPLSLFIYKFASKIVKQGNTPPFIRKTKTECQTRCRGKTMWHLQNLYKDETCLFWS